MLVKELLEYRHYGPRPRPEGREYTPRDRISKKPTDAKRKRDRLIRRKASKLKNAQRNQEALARR